MSEIFPTECENCGTSIDTESFRGKGKATENKPKGHKDPRYADGCYCSVNCSKAHHKSGGTIYAKA